MSTNRRILIIDDNRSIHEDFRKILTPTQVLNAELTAFEDQLFGASTPATTQQDGFEISSAFQGREGVDAIQQAETDGRPFAVAFVDVRMPPGWDGVETISRIWQLAPNLQVVICTAYSDYSWEQIVEKLGHSDRLLLLRKPFDPVEVLQLAKSLTEKWTEQNEVPPRH
jgi:CheY-like chemotaxis protein